MNILDLRYVVTESCIRKEIKLLWYSTNNTACRFCKNYNYGQSFSFSVHTNILLSVQKRCQKNMIMVFI